MPEVAVADGVGGAVSGNALKAGKDAAIKADLGPMPPATGDKADPGDGASFKPRCPLPPDLIEINGTVSVCTPSDAEACCAAGLRSRGVRGGGCRRPSPSSRR